MKTRPLHSLPLGTFPLKVFLSASLFPGSQWKQEFKAFLNSSSRLFPDPGGQVSQRSSFFAHHPLPRPTPIIKLLISHEHSQDHPPQMV